MNQPHRSPHASSGGSFTKLSFLLGIFSALLFIGVVSATTYQCDSCSSCQDAVDGASSNDLIILNTSISGDGDCIDITTSNFTFDCQGHTISGFAGSDAIGIYSAENVRIQNCNFSTASGNNAIYLETSNNITASNISIYGSDAKDLVKFYQTNNSVIDCNWVSYRATLAELTGFSTNNTIRDCVTRGRPTSGTRRTIDIYGGSSFNTFENISSTEMAYFVAFDSDNSHENNRDNTFSDMVYDAMGYEGYCFYAPYASNTIVDNISCRGNDFMDGIDFQKSINAHVNNVYLEGGSGGSGFNLIGSPDSVVTNARIMGNSFGTLIGISEFDGIPSDNVTIENVVLVEGSSFQTLFQIAYSSNILIENITAENTEETTCLFSNPCISISAQPEFGTHADNVTIRNILLGGLYLYNPYNYAIVDVSGANNTRLENIYVGGTSHSEYSFLKFEKMHGAYFKNLTVSDYTGGDFVFIDGTTDKQLTNNTFDTFDIYSSVGGVWQWESGKNNKWKNIKMETADGTFATAFALANADGIGQNEFENIDISGYNFGIVVGDKNNKIKGLKVRGALNGIVSVSDNTTFSDLDLETDNEAIILGDELHGDSNNNTFFNISITGTGSDGIYIQHGDYNKISKLRFNGNGGGNGIRISAGSGQFNEITDSEIVGADIGIYLDGSGVTNNTFCRNLFNNTLNVESGDTENFNIWDCEGAGNYWADPEGTGFSETCTDSNHNGRCDEEYVPGEEGDNLGIDYSPLSESIDPPIITIIAPAGNYTSASVPLRVSSDKIMNRWWYSLNGGSNVTFTPNTTITGLNGSNALIVYGNDTIGNIGMAETSFYITLGPSPTPRPTITNLLPSPWGLLAAMILGAAFILLMLVMLLGNVPLTTKTITGMIVMLLILAGILSVVL